MLSSLGVESFNDLSPEMKKVMCDQIIKGFNEDTSADKPDLEAAMTIVKSTFGQSSKIISYLS